MRSVRDLTIEKPRIVLTIYVQTCFIDVEHASRQASMAALSGRIPRKTSRNPTIGLKLIAFQVSSQLNQSGNDC